jgi:ABC-2 type transport system permease protein
MFRKNYFEILWILAKTDFKMRYYGSLFGYLWSLAKPLLIFIVLYIVFSIFMNFDIPNFQLYLLSGIIIWNFFAEGTIFGLNSLISKNNLLRNIYFPRILLVISSVLNAFFTLLINLIIFFAVFFVTGLDFDLKILLIPFYLFVLLILVISFSLFFSVLQVRFRDISQIWEVFLQLGFFLTPIIYPVTFIPEKYKFFIFLNPVANIVYDFRLIILNHELPSLNFNLLLFFEIIILFFSSLYFFQKYSYKVIEKI